jgi:inorganic triphosphatase YgiF
VPREEVVMQQVLLFALALACLAAAPASAQAKWVSFRSKQARFSVEMPTQPKATTTKTTSFIGTITDEIFTSGQGDERFTVDHSQIPRFALDFAGADTIYDHASAALLKQTWSKQLSFADVTVNGRQGKQLVYDTPPVPGKPKIKGLANLFLVGDRLYVVDAAVPAGESEADARRFLASVRFE